MEEATNFQQPTQQQQTPSLIPSSDVRKEMDSLSSISKMLNSISDYPNTLRREFRGEMMFEDDKGNVLWVQGTKPVFIKLDFETGEPLKEKTKMPWGEEKELYVVNDEAIEEVISMLKFAGINQINPVGYNSPDNYLDDLKEFECKLAGLLALKQREWGIDKELLPTTHFKIKTIIQDVRSLSINGNLLKTIQTTTQRIEQFVENDSNRRNKFNANPY